MTDWTDWTGCAHCRADVDRLDEFCYMVGHELWAAHGAGRGVLCIGCLEERMGRRLTPGDFIDVPLNGPEFRHSPRLRDRLAGV